MERIIWINGSYTLNHFVPGIAVIKDLDYIEICEEFVERWILNGASHQLSLDTFKQLVDVDDLSLLLTIVFNNSSNLETNLAPVHLLAIDLFLCGISSTVTNEAGVTRNDAITQFVKRNIGHLVSLLMKIAQKFGGSRKYIKDQIYYFPAPEILDNIFEAMDVQPFEDTQYFTEDIIRVPGLVRPISKVLQSCCKEPLEIAAEIKKCLCNDPFDIDGTELDVQPSTSCSTRKSTTCAPVGRRRVKIIKWKRIQMLTKSTYKNVHLVLGGSDSQETSMIFSPHSALSATLDNIQNCTGIVLGPTNGPVIVRNCKNITVSVVCRSIFIVNCESVRLFYASEKPLVILGSRNIRTSYFNVPYAISLAQGFGHSFRNLLSRDGSFLTFNLREQNCKLLGMGKSLLKRLEEELRSVLLDLHRLANLRDTLGDEPKEAEFFMQPVPYTVRDKDELFLLSHLPEEVRELWLHNPDQDKENEERAQWQLPKKDLLYLKSKISQFQD